MSPVSGRDESAFDRQAAARRAGDRADWAPDGTVLAEAHQLALLLTG